MTFSVFGIMDDRVVQVTWKDGELEGDSRAVARIQARAFALEGREVGRPSGPFTLEEHLSDANSALYIIDEVLDEIGSTAGEMPVAENDPEDDGDDSERNVVY